MNDFNPGPGWREVAPTDPATDNGDVLTLIGPDTDRYWVRAVPVPQFPTEPYTVIRVTWRDSDNAGAVYMLHPDGKWGPYEVDYIAQNITSWSVLSEPRAVTAKAVADKLNEAGYDVAEAAVRRVFGVKS